MTKLKSKKMSKSTFAVIIMAILMVAMLAFGGTYAWFTSGSTITMTDGATTNMGKIALAEGETKISSTSLKANVLPSESVFVDGQNTFDLIDKSNRASYIFFIVTADIAQVDTFDTDGVTPKTYKTAENLPLGMGSVTTAAYDGDQSIAINALTYGEGEDEVTVAYYIQTAETSTVTVGKTFTIAGFNATLDGATYDDDYQQAKITVTVEAASVQVEGLDAKAAFAKVFADKVPATGV